MSQLSQFAGQGVTFGPTRMVLATESWSPQVSGWYCIFLVGGGGSGGVINTVANDLYIANGGNGGSSVLAVRYLSSSTTYTITLGAGGTGVNQGSSGTTAGNDGNSSTMTGTGLTTLTATGGRGGSVHSDPTTPFGTDTFNSANAAPSGGDYNMTGGLGGGCDFVGTSSPSNGISVITGGGAVRIHPDITDDQIRGGDVNFISGWSITGDLTLATGGGGIRGHGGDMTVHGGNATGISQGDNASTGGTCLGSALTEYGDNSTGQAINRNEVGMGGTSDPFIWGMWGQPARHWSQTSDKQDAIPGFGCGGVGATAGMTDCSGFYTGGFLAGAAGYIYNNNWPSNDGRHEPTSRMGGGSGGVGDDNAAYSGDGGQGGCFLARMSHFAELI